MKVLSLFTIAMVIAAAMTSEVSLIEQSTMEPHQEFVEAVNTIVDSTMKDINPVHVPMLQKVKCMTLCNKIGGKNKGFCKVMCTVGKLVPKKLKIKICKKKCKKKCPIKKLCDVICKKIF